MEEPGFTIDDDDVDDDDDDDDDVDDDDDDDDDDNDDATEEALNQKTCISANRQPSSPRIRKKET